MSVYSQSFAFLLVHKFSGDGVSIARLPFDHRLRTFYLKRPLCWNSVPTVKANAFLCVLVISAQTWQTVVDVIAPRALIKVCPNFSQNNDRLFPSRPSNINVVSRTMCWAPLALRQCYTAPFPRWPHSGRLLPPSPSVRGYKRAI